MKISALWNRLRFKWTRVEYEILYCCCCKTGSQLPISSEHVGGKYRVVTTAYNGRKVSIKQNLDMIEFLYQFKWHRLRIWQPSSRQDIHNLTPNTASSPTRFQLKRGENGQGKYNFKEKRATVVFPQKNYNCWKLLRSYMVSFTCDLRQLWMFWGGHKGVYHVWIPK